MWALRVATQRSMRLISGVRLYSNLHTQSQETIMSAQSVARILDAHENSSELSTLNQALASIIQVSSVQGNDKVSLSDKRCHDLVNKVLTSIGGMNPEDIVHLGDWLSKAKQLRVGWRDLSQVERNTFRQKLSEHAKEQQFTVSELISLLKSCSALGLPYKPVTIALERLLGRTEIQVHLMDVQRMLEVLGRTNKVSGRLVWLVLEQLRRQDTTLMDPKVQVSLYQSLCSLETSLQFEHIIAYLETFTQSMTDKLRHFGEEELMEWMDVHSHVKHPRHTVTHALLNEVTRRLEKPDQLSRNFLFFILKPLTTFKSHQRITLPESVFSRLLIEISKNLQSQSIYPNDFEGMVRRTLHLTNTFPEALTTAIKRKIQSYSRESLWLPTCLHYFRKAGEDVSFLNSYITALPTEVHLFPVTDRLTMLNGVYLGDLTPDLQTIEDVLAGSFKQILDEKHLHRSLNLLHRILLHPNRMIMKKVDYARKEVLEQLFLPWSHDLLTYWALYLSYFTYPGNEEMWVKFLEKASVTSLDYIHSISQLSISDHCLEPVLHVLHKIAPSATIEAVFFTQRLFDIHTDLRFILQYLKIANSVDIFSTHTSVVTRILDFLLMYSKEKSVFEAVPDLLQALKRMYEKPPGDMDSIAKGKIATLLAISGNLTSAEGISFIKDYLNEKGTTMMAVTVASHMWPEVKAAGLLPSIQQALNMHRYDESILLVKIKCGIYASLPRELLTELPGVKVMKRLKAFPEHMYPLIVDLVSTFPCRLLSLQGDFTLMFTRLLLKQYMEGVFLDGRAMLRLLRVLGEHRVGVARWRELVMKIMNEYKLMEMGMKVDLLEMVGRWGDGFADVASHICQDISKSPRDYIPYTGRILGCLSDGNQQHALHSAQVAESLVFSPYQSFSFSPNSIAQILMFCLRIGMEDSPLTRKLLSLPPPSVHGSFNLKRYLLHLHYKNQHHPHFSLTSELTSFKKDIESEAYMHFHTPNSLDSVSDPTVVKKTFVQDVYIPVLEAEGKKARWTVPILALQHPKKKDLQGDYSFYLKICKEVAGVETELTYDPRLETK